MIRLSGIVASLPSPSSGTLNIGPLRIHAYGLMIALGIIAGVWLMGRRFEQRGIGTRDDANAVAMWGVIGGVIGARLYHVVTDWSKFAHHLSDIPKIWQGGLGIPGGLLLGIIAGVWAMKRRNVPVATALDCAAPALPLAQSIGRWGNWWNQELYGRATTLPWGLRIDNDHLPVNPATKHLYASGTLFQPTFLYESLANVALCGLLLLIDRRSKPRVGHLLAMYLMGYGVIRFFVEGLRIDEAHHIAGLRLNQWVALAAVVGAGAYIAISSRRPSPEVAMTTAAEMPQVATEQDPEVAPPAPPESQD
ncbi:unannotated protein [freshwater metagenome]|uniref:Unannotated protein n=1 Tax=freshwater metagenome TaxID=449393 RepID=A0A6J7CKA3_9ZZZZ